MCMSSASVALGTTFSWLPMSAKKQLVSNIIVRRDYIVKFE